MSVRPSPPSKSSVSSSDIGPSSSPLNELRSIMKVHTLSDSLNSCEKKKKRKSSALRPSFHFFSHHNHNHSHNTATTTTNTNKHHDGDHGHGGLKSPSYARRSKSMVVRKNSVEKESSRQSLEISRHSRSLRRTDSSSNTDGTLNTSSGSHASSSGNANNVSGNANKNDASRDTNNNTNNVSSSEGRGPIGMRIGLVKELSLKTSMMKVRLMDELGEISECDDDDDNNINNNNDDDDGEYIGDVHAEVDHQDPAQEEQQQQAKQHEGHELKTPKSVSSKRFTYPVVQSSSHLENVQEEEQQDPLVALAQDNDEKNHLHHDGHFRGFHNPFHIRQTVRRVVGSFALGRLSSSASDDHNDATKEGNNNKRNTDSTIKISLVRFADVTIREYELTASDNPCVRAGAAIELGWKYNILDQTPLEDYEALRSSTRTPDYQKEKRLTRHERERILREFGASDKDIQEAAKRAAIIRNKRKRSIAMMKHDELYEALEDVRGVVLSGCGLFGVGMMCRRHGRRNGVVIEEYYGTKLHPSVIAGASKASLHGVDESATSSSALNVA